MRKIKKFIVGDSSLILSAEQMRYIVGGENAQSCHEGALCAFYFETDPNQIYYGYCGILSGDCYCKHEKANIHHHPTCWN